MEAEKLKPQILATIDDLNQYLQGNVTALGLIDTLKDTINYIEDYAMTIRENNKMNNLNENIGGKIEIEFQDWLDMMYTDKDYPEIETLETVIDYAQDTLRDYRADYTVFENKNKKMENLNEGKKKKASAYMAELAEIDKQSAIVAMEAKINHLQEMADKKNERLKMVSEDENLSELIDSKKKKSMEREIKEIEKAKAKLEKVYEKMSGGKKKEIVDEDKEDMDETYSASTYEEDDSVSEGGYDSNYEEDDSMNEEFLRMQKLAGVISEEEYKKKLNEKESYDLKVGGALNSLKGLNVSYMYEEGKPVNTKIVSTDVGETKDGKEFININFSPDTGMTLTDDDFVAWGSQRQKGVFPVSDSRKMKKTVVSKEFF